MNDRDIAIAVLSFFVGFASAMLVVLLMTFL